MDGKPWSDHDDSQKARMAKGSNSGIPIGVHAIGSFTNVMPCEGGLDYLRLVSLLHECGFGTDILPVIMPSASSRKIDLRIVGCFKDKRVRICAQNDKPGITAARAWQAQLEGVGATVDIWIAPKIQVSNGGFTKDLDDLFWKLDPDIRGKLRELHNLINFGVRLFPAPRIASAENAAYLSGEPADDARFVAVFAHSLEHTGGYPPEEARRVAGKLLPDLLRYDPTRPASFPDNGRTLTDDVQDAFLAILTNGKGHGG